MTQTMLARFGHDLPVLPEHWHKRCDCTPTVAYIRVSKVGKKTTIKSPKIQFDEIVQDAKYNKRKIVDIVFDLNVSGRDFDRKAFAQVIENVKAGTYRHVSVWKWSRWGRNLRASLVMLQEVEDLGASVDSATEPIDTSTSFGKYSRDQMLSLANLQADQIGENWKKVHGYRLDAMLPHSGRKRFGYDYNTEDERDKFYGLNEDEAEILAWAYDQFLDGTGTRQLAMAFNERGFRTEFGGLWTYQAVGKMLDTGFAAGLLRSRSEERKRAMKKKPANTLSSYDQWNPGKQETVIDLETWENYKAKRLGRAKMPPRSRRAVHAVSALVFCGSCSWRMSTHYGGPQKQHRWQCEARNTFHPGQAVSVSNEDVIMLVKEWLSSKGQEDWVEKEAKREFDRAQKAAVPARKADEKRLAEINRELARVMELVKSGGLSDVPKIVMQQLADLENEQSAMEAKLAEPEQKGRAEPDWVAMQLVCENWDSFPPETHNAALGQAIGMIVVSPPSRPRVRSELRSRVRIVPVWEMDEWAAWFASFRTRVA